MAHPNPKPKMRSYLLTSQKILWTIKRGKLIPTSSRQQSEDPPTSRGAGRPETKSFLPIQISCVKEILQGMSSFPIDFS